jgi:hypothetical protein
MVRRKEGRMSKRTGRRKEGRKDTGILGSRDI